MENMPDFFLNICKICKREFSSITEKPYCGMCILNYARVKKK